MATLSTFDLTGTQAASAQSGEYYLALSAGTSPVLATASNSSLSMVQFDLSSDADDNPLTYAIAGQLLGSVAGVALNATGVLTMVEAQANTPGPESWQAVFALKQTYDLLADGTDTDTLPDGFSYLDELGHTVAVKLNWFGTRVFDGAIASFYATVNQASAQSAGNEFFGRVLDLNGDGVADQLVSSLGGRSMVANVVGVSSLSWRMESFQSASGRIQANSAGQVTGFYFSFDDYGPMQAWQLSTLGSSTGAPESGELYLKLGAAAAGSGGLVTATSSLFPQLSFDAFADTDNNFATYALKGSLLNSSGQPQSAKGSLTLTDATSGTAGPEAWAAKFLVKESVSLIADGSDSGTLEDGFLYSDSLGHAVAVPFVWNASADSSGVLANFSATINQLTPADVGLALSGQLLDSDGNGTPDKMNFNVGNQAIKGTLQKSAEVWQVYYQVEMSGRTAVDGTGNVTGLYFNPSNLSYGKTYPEVPAGFDLKIKPLFWKGWSTSTAQSIPSVSITEGGVTASTLVNGALSLTNVEDTDGVTGDGIFQISPSASAPANAKSAITLTDVLAALKIYLGKSVPDSYASPFNFVAADFDQSGAVTLTDVLQLLKYYLGKSTANSPEWVFVNAADLQGSGVASTLQSATTGASVSKALTTTKVVAHDFSVDAAELQLIGVLRGDVDGSWTSA
jgi:hypothetical protein